NTDTESVTVNPLPEPSISGLTEAYCVDAAASVLSTNLEGSIFSISNNGNAPVENGPGLTVNATDTLFVPADAGVGDHTIFLTNTDPVTGCVGVDSIQLTVNPLPSDVSIIDLDASYCVGGDVDVFQGFPSASSGISGIFQLFDINGTLLEADLGTAFDPSAFDKGEYDIQYTFTDNNGCQDQATSRVIIHPNPVASFLREGDCVSDTLKLLNQSFFETGDTGTINSFQWEYLSFVDFDENSILADPPASSFTIMLTVGTQVGCQDDTLSGTQFIGADPFFDYFSSVACVGGFNTVFQIQDINNNGFGLEDTDTITSIIYEYGDGNIVQNNNEVVFHPYDDPGLYQSTVTINTNQNCSQSVSRPVVVVPNITSFPYFEDFEADQGDWNTLARDPDSTSTWEYGTPSGAVINSAAGGTKAWATNLDGEYPANEDSWVYGPCFDLTQLNRPMLSLDIWNDTQDGFDGVVIEHSTDGITWFPTAEVGDGINWYNSSVIIGQPGDQTIAPIGFSGQTGGWINARVKLDQYKTSDDFRIRIAFGSDANNPGGTALEGFAFDNVFVGERSRGVLFEHFTNLNDPNAQAVDEFLYDELLQNNFNESEFNPLDVVYMQYHIGVPSADAINLENTADPSARTLLYGIDETGKAQINGLVFGNGDSQPADGDPWQQIDLDQQALPDPLFNILLPPASVSGSTISASAVITANEDLSLDTLDVHLVIVEDNVVVGSRTLQGVLREMLPDAAGTPFVQAWSAGETANISYSYTFDPTVVDANNLEVIAFIQDRETQEVVQANSTRDLSIFVDVEEPIETFSLAVFPNPASHMINLNFDQTIPETIQWQLNDALGRVIDGGELDPGNYNYQLPTTQWPDGFYFLQVGSEDMGFRIEKIIISKQP
ncbi:MAG: PKD domain-containing protein, partial [Bacteroidota bacterium]